MQNLRAEEALIQMGLRMLEPEMLTSVRKLIFRLVGRQSEFQIVEGAEVIPITKNLAE